MLLKKWKVGQFGLSLDAVHWIGVLLALTSAGVTMTTVLSRTATTAVMASTPPPRPGQR